MTDMGPDPDSILADLDFDVLVPEDVIDVTTLPNYELSCLDRDTREELLKRGEMHTPIDQCSERGRALHSTFIACKIEMNKRHLNP